MGKRLLIFAIVFVALLAFTIWRAQPTFRLQRKLLAKLPYAPDRLLITDLDDDGHPEVTALRTGEPTIWVRFPFDKPSPLRFENCRAVWVASRSVLKALPVLTADRRLRLLRWRDGKASLEPLPAFPDVSIDEALINEGKGTGTLFLQVRRGKDVWVFTLTPKGEWQFASRFERRMIRLLADLADLNRDGKLDALCEQWHPIKSTWVLWGGRKERKTILGVWVRYGYPQIADLDRNGWMEIVMVAEDRRLKVWRFDRRERRLKVIATSLPLPVGWDTLDLFDLDGDGQKEIVVICNSGDSWVFQWREGKLKIWQGKTGFQDAEVWHRKQVKFGDQLALCGYHFRPILLFPPRIWLKGWKLRWQFQEWASLTFFALPPRGEKALSPSNWRIQEAPFELEFAGDIDGDGSDEVIGYDGRWRRRRLYRAEVTKSGELRWRDVLLGREKPEPTAFALLVDGKRRGFVVGWEDGRLELLTIEGRR